MKRFSIPVLMVFFLVLSMGLPLTASAKAKKDEKIMAAPQAEQAVQPVSNVRSGLSLGIGWPYVGLKYFFNNDLGLEGRFSTGDGINVYAARGYWSFLRYGNFSLQTGAEFGYFTFNTMNSSNTLRVSGDGYEIAPLVGIDYFADRNLSVLLDFSMPVIDLSSHQVSLGDVEWVFEGGLYFYPF